MLALDLPGSWKIFIFWIDTAKQTITPNDPAYVEAKLGAEELRRFVLWYEWPDSSYVLCEGQGDGPATLTYDAA